MADTKIKTKNPGILEVPEDKKFWQLPLTHYEKLVDKKGYAKIIRALTNLEVWKVRKRMFLELTKSCLKHFLLIRAILMMCKARLKNLQSRSWISLLTIAEN